MNHKPIFIQDLSLHYSHKNCFTAFNGQIYPGDRIAIIGRNGAGKSTLLKILHGSHAPTEGDIYCPQEIGIGYLPQVIYDFPELSGGQRLNQLLTTILATNPDVLLLDEPTNHLDSRNRRSLMRMLQHYHGTLVFVSHDIALIDALAHTLWHIEGEKITVFSGSYADYQRNLTQKRATIEQELAHLSRQKKEAHRSLMKQQERNKQARIKGEKHLAQSKWPTIRSQTKLAAAVTTGDKRLQHINQQRQHLSEQLAGIYQPEVLQAKFTLQSAECLKTLVMIQDAAVSYVTGPPILSDIQFSLTTKARIALHGDNGSGKSTLVKAILQEPIVQKTGNWVLPTREEIGYLDQHYQQLTPGVTVLEHMTRTMPKLSHAAIRAHLNAFLFRKNEEVHTLIEDLSGGEKARLSLALIAANPPKLLLLDELTNNLDIETRTHVIEVLRKFLGAMVVISHDEDFLTALHIDTRYRITQGKVQHEVDYE